MSKIPYKVSQLRKNLSFIWGEKNLKLSQWHKYWKYLPKTLK